MQLTKTAIRLHPLRVGTLAFLMAHFAPIGDFLVVTGLHDIGDVTLRVHLEQKPCKHINTFMITFMKLCSLLLHTGWVDVTPSSYGPQLYYAQTLFAYTYTCSYAYTYAYTYTHRTWFPSSCLQLQLIHFILSVASNFVKVLSSTIKILIYAEPPTA